MWRALSPRYTQQIMQPEWRREARRLKPPRSPHAHSYHCARHRNGTLTEIRTQHTALKPGNVCTLHTRQAQTSRNGQQSSSKPSALALKADQMLAQLRRGRVQQQKIRSSGARTTGWQHSQRRHSTPEQLLPLNDLQLRSRTAPLQVAPAPSVPARAEEQTSLSSGERCA